MDKQEFKNFLSDLRYLTLFPRRYRTSGRRPADYWHSVFKDYKNTEKLLDSSDYHWRVLEFKDGHKELAYLRVLQDGVFSGYASAIYRGLVIPRRVDYPTFANIERIRLAF